MADKKIPAIKKNIESFLRREEGKITKKSVLDLGIGIVALSGLLKVILPGTSDAFTTHISHSSCHSSGHSSHGSHSSCHSNCSCGGGCSLPPQPM